MKKIVIGALVLATVIVIALVGRSLAGRAKEAETKQQLLGIQLALEKYAVSNSLKSYPLTMQNLIESDYLNELPKNPFSGQPMKEVALGETPNAGDFSYVPRIKRVGPSQLLCTDYLLVAYSARRTNVSKMNGFSVEGFMEAEAVDWDHVVIEFSSRNQLSIIPSQRTP